MGAGVIPFAVLDGEVQFLFQKTFTGRKVGHLIDFGGGVGAGESYEEAAIREFVEETETMYFAPEIGAVSVTEAAVQSQIPRVRQLFGETLQAHPGWWSPRAVTPGGKPKDWQTFFIRFDYRELSEMNRAWALDQGQRFKKRRELQWIPAEELLATYADRPERLWKRVRELSRAELIIRSIQSEYDERPATVSAPGDDS
jgi:8-oxo-dGTP pyrophosphatase MutT (NUDIX family)